jgi:hypothetical protein
MVGGGGSMFGGLPTIGLGFPHRRGFLNGCYGNFWLGKSGGGSMVRHLLLKALKIKPALEV